MLNIDTLVRTNTRTIDDYRRYLNQVMAIQSETVRRLTESDSLPPIEMAAVLEDIANTFLDLSDEIRDVALGRR